MGQNYVHLAMWDCFLGSSCQENPTKIFEIFKNPLLGKCKMLMVLSQLTIFEIFFDVICRLIDAISMSFLCVYLCKIQKMGKMQNLGLKYKFLKKNN